MNIEVCTDCVEGAIAAGKYGAIRIELCSSLSLGGLTPSYGLIKQCVEKTKVEVHVIIRHKEGGFQYDALDIEIMKSDILQAKNAGASGVVFGVLDKENNISNLNKDLVDLAKNLQLEVTFHRAFDFVDNPQTAIKKIIDMGFDRLLTSGLRETATEGLETITELQSKFGSKIQIMAGSGIHAGNALKISETGIENIHFTARKKSNKKPSGIFMGEMMITDKEKIQSITDLFNQGITAE